MLKQGSGADPAYRWYVLHTRSRQEKALALDLKVRGIDHFLPVTRQARYHGRRKVKVDAPLFPSYIFLRGSRDEVFEADRTRRVARIIDVPDQSYFEWELSQIQRVLDAETPMDQFPYLEVGMPVQVKSGPLRGLRGIIDKQGRQDLLVLQVNMIGRAASLEIEGSLLEPIG